MKFKINEGLQIPQNLISKFYSYLTFEELFKKIFLLNKEQKKFLITDAKLDQDRELIIYFDQEYIYYDSLIYLLELCSSFDIHIIKFDMKNLWAFKLLNSDQYIKKIDYVFLDFHKE